MNSLTIPPFNQKRLLRSRCLYFNRYRGTGQIELNPLQSDALKKLKNDGYVKLNKFIQESDLTHLVSQLNHELNNGNLEYPALAQSLIKEDQHQDLIHSYFYASSRTLKKRGLVFEKKDFTTYKDTLEKFKPSTLKCLIPSNALTYFNTWLNTEILEIIHSYMGLKPYLVEAYIRRNFPARHKNMNHFWHRDLNNVDHLLKVFFFLSDCDKTTGPHEFISGSHKDLSMNGKRYFDDKEVNEKYPTSSGKVIRSIVKKGTVIIEDTRGLHRASIPKKRFRDLGYAVFLPYPVYKRKYPSHYKINQEAYNSLASYQQSYIPGGNIC